MSIGRPVMSITTESGGGALGAATGLLGGGALDMGEAGVARLSIDLGIDSAHDRLVLLLSKLSPLADIEAGTIASVGLATMGDTTDVITAHVVRVDDRPDGREVVCLAPSHLLSHSYPTRSYVQQTVADVVHDLLDNAEVDADVVDAGHSLDQFHVDGRRSSWGTLHVLARLFGAEITSGADGALSFRPAPGASAGGLGGGLAGAAAGAAGALGLSADGGLRIGANVLDWALGPQHPVAATSPDVAPLGAASPFGAPRGHHLLKNPDAGTERGSVHPALRNTSAADGAGTALKAAATRRMTGGRITVPGDPTIRAGDDLTIDDTTWHVRTVRHWVSPASGYTCDVTVEGVA